MNKFDENSNKWFNRVGGFSVRGEVCVGGGKGLITYYPYWTKAGDELRRQLDIDKWTEGVWGLLGGYDHDLEVRNIRQYLEEEMQFGSRWAATEEELDGLTEGLRSVLEKAVRELDRLGGDHKGSFVKAHLRLEFRPDEEIKALIKAGHATYEDAFRILVDEYTISGPYIGVGLFALA